MYAYWCVDMCVCCTDVLIFSCTLCEFCYFHNFLYGVENKLQRIQSRAAHV